MKEFDLIDALAGSEPLFANGLALGIGDDCAVIDGDDLDWLVTTDAIVEGIHFDLSWTDFYLLGRKALSVNLSDIAAMGGAPRFYLATISVPSEYNPHGMIEFYRGMKDVAKVYNAVMIGGDTTASKSGLWISITAIGQSPHGKAITRGGARVGDSIFVSGSLGDAALALGILKNGQEPEGGIKEKFLNPSPKVELGKWLLSTGLVTSMIDISDGLLQDLGHIASRSGVGFEIWAGDIPQTAQFIRTCDEMGFDPFRLSLSGGEDYELLFTAPQNFSRDFAGAFCKEIREIGKIVEDKNTRTVLGRDGKILEFSVGGFDHFGG